MNPIPEHDQQLIDKYLRNELSSTEQATFNQRMNDPAFKVAVEEMTSLRQALKTGGRERLRGEFRSWDRRGRRPAIFRLRNIAAAAALLALVAAFCFLLPTDTTEPSLADAYLDPYPNVVAPIQKSASDPSSFERAFQLYESGRYARAEKLFAGLDQTNDSVEFYRGINHLMAGQAEQALEQLQTVTSDPTHTYYRAGLWYLALSQVKLGQTDNARVTLRQVVATGPPFDQKAIELMNGL